MKGQIEIPKNVKPIKVEFDEQIIPPNNVEPAVSSQSGGPIITPPENPAVDPPENPAVDPPENEFAKEIEELENKIKAIKDSKTAQAIKNSWDKLWDKVEGAASDASTQLKVLILKQKIDAAARKVTPAGQTMNFVDCTGWNTLGCKSDSIKKVQNCMDIGVSGNFDEFLKSELARYKSTYAFREGFSDSDVQKICAYKQEENRQEALKREQLAKQAQKAAEIQAFERKYPQVFTPATERDEF